MLFCLIVDSEGSCVSVSIHMPRVTTAVATFDNGMLPVDVVLVGIGTLICRTAVARSIAAVGVVINVLFCFAALGRT
jgi:hypothetical protein